jgi:flagellar basal body-associated protein FliL
MKIGRKSNKILKILFLVLLWLLPCGTILVIAFLAKNPKILNNKHES